MPCCFGRMRVIDLKSFLFYTMYIMLSSFMTALNRLIRRVVHNSKSDAIFKVNLML